MLTRAKERTSIVSAQLRLKTTIHITLVETPAPAKQGKNDSKAVAARKKKAHTAALCTGIERRTAIAYLAFYFSLDENGRAGFRSDHLHWLNDLTAQCTASPSKLQKLLGAAPTAPSRECVTRAYMLRAEAYRRKLHGSALEEANLSPSELRNIQRRLVELKLLSGSIDGTFGVETRRAIAARRRRARRTRAVRGAAVQSPLQVWQQPPPPNDHQ